MTTRSEYDDSPSASSTVGTLQNEDLARPQPPGDIERLAPLLVQGIFSTCKTVQIYDSHNRAVKTVLTRLMLTLEELFQLEGRATLKVATDLLFLNEVLINVEPQSMDPILFLIEEMKRKKVEEIDIGPDVTAGEIGAFLKLFTLEPTEEDVYGELNRWLMGAGIKNIQLTEWIERARYLKDARVERREIREESNRAMSRAILYMGEILKSIEQKRPIQLPKAHRLTQQIADIIQTDESVIIGLASIKDYDEYTFSHSVNVSVLSILTAERMGLNKSIVSQIGVAALLHDIGKTHVPKSILNKPSKLTSEEWMIMERHSMLGAIELSRVRSLRAVIDPIFSSLQHHLFYNLGGYPRKPGSWNLHPYIDFITVADVFDALTTPRIYRENTLTPDKAMRFILAKSGELFNPLIVKVFIKAMGIYPVGTVVELDTGEKAVVTKQNEKIHLLHRPIVSLLNEDGSCSEPVDLAELAGQGPLYRRTIVNSIRHAAYEAQKAACFIQK